MRRNFDMVLGGVDADRVREAIVGALLAGGEAAADAHEFSKPRSDGHTFGVNLWRFVWHDLEAAFQDFSGVTVHRADGSFLIDLGSCWLYPISIRPNQGSSGPADRVELSERRRDLLSKPTAHLPLELPPVVIIAFAGRPDRGVVTAWVGVATLLQDDTLDWQWREELELGGEIGAGRAVGEDRAETSVFFHAPEPTLELGLLDDEAQVDGEPGSGSAG